MWICLLCLCTCTEAKKTIVLNEFIRDKWNEYRPQLKGRLRSANLIYQSLSRPAYRLLDGIQEKIDEIKNSKAFTDAYHKRQQTLAEIRERWAEEGSEDKPEETPIEDMPGEDPPAQDWASPPFVIQKINIDDLLKTVGQLNPFAAKQGDAEQNEEQNKEGPQMIRIDQDKLPSLENITLSVVRVASMFLSPMLNNYQ